MMSGRDVSTWLPRAHSLLIKVDSIRGRVANAATAAALAMATTLTTIGTRIEAGDHVITYPPLRAIV
jgi:hypothetical protein